MRKGFTLIEVIIVILLIGILSTLALPGFNTYREKIKITHMMEDVHQIEQACDLYVLEHGWGFVSGHQSCYIDNCPRLSGFDLPTENPDFTYEVNFWPTFICIHTEEGPNPGGQIILWTQHHSDGDKEWYIITGTRWEKYLRRLLPNASIHTYHP